MSFSIDEISEEPRVVAKPMMRLGEVLGKMKEERVWTVPVVDDKNRLVGVLSYRSILLKGVGRDTKIYRVMEPPYSIKSGTVFNEAVAKIVMWKARGVPIVDEKKHLISFITREKILEVMISKNFIPSIEAQEAMSTPPITIIQNESIARARWLMLRSGISRLPVLDRENGRIVGVITLRDIAERLYNIRMTRRRGFEWIQSEEEFLAAPVKDFMSTPPITVTPSTTLIDVAKTLLQYNISGVPVVLWDRVVGVLSGIDIMKKYIEKLIEVRPFEVKISESGVSEDPILRLQIEKLLNDYISKIQRFIDVIDFKISIKEETKTAKEEGRHRYNIRIRITTNLGSFSATGIGWEVLTALRDALTRLERRLRKYVEKIQTYKPFKGVD